jgi:hypothetical protein
MKQTHGFGKEVKRRVEYMVKRIMKQLVKRSMKQIVSEMKRRIRTCYVHGKPWIVTLAPPYPLLLRKQNYIFVVVIVLNQDGVGKCPFRVIFREIL